MKENQSKEYLFERQPIPSAVMQLSLPLVLTALVTILYNLADTFFVGMLNDSVQNAAVTLIYPVMLAFNAVNNLFGVGVSSAMSRGLGSRQYELVRVSSAFGFYGAVSCGLLFSLICGVFQIPLLGLLGADATTIKAAKDYMHWTVLCGATPAILNVVQGYMYRSEGNSLHAGIGAIVGCILNMILDPFFILPWGLGMGAAGAGLATFISNCLSCLYFFVMAFIKRGRTYVCMDIKALCLLRWRWVRDVFYVGIPASIQNLLNVLGSALLNNFTAAFGATAIAAMGISNKLYMIPLQMALGFAQGIMPLVSYNYSSDNRKRMKETIVFALKVIIPAMIFTTFCYWFLAPYMIQKFMDNKEIIAYGTRFLRIMSFGLVFLCVDFLAVGVFQSLGRGLYAFLFAVLRKLVLEIPLLLLLNWLYPLYGLPFAQFVAETVMFVLGIKFLAKECRG